MGAAASAINHSDLTNDEKVLITKVNILQINSNLFFDKCLMAACTFPICIAIMK
jgi:hypothetical protein